MRPRQEDGNDFRRIIHPSVHASKLITVDNGPEPLSLRAMTMQIGSRLLVIFITLASLIEADREMI